MQLQSAFRFAELSLEEHIAPIQEEFLARESRRSWVDLRSVAGVVAAMLVLGCGKVKPSDRKREGAQPTDSQVRGVAGDTGAAPREKGVSEQMSQAPHPGTPLEVLSGWTRALNDGDLSELERLYADRVLYYGSWLDRNQVLQRKREALAATNGFGQSVLGSPHVEHEGDLVRVRFLKRSGPPNAQQDIFAALVLRKSSGFLVHEETDAVTEKRYGSGSAFADAPRDCLSAAWRMVDSTPAASRLYKKINENLKEFPKEAELRPGGMGPFMPSETDEGTYELSIGVHHPERFEAYGWFSISRIGRITVSSMTLDLLDAPTEPSKVALTYFRKFCIEK